MKRFITVLGVGVLVVFTASLGLAKEKKPKPGPMTGTWDCQSKGGSQGDLPFTLYLDQQKEVVSGSVTSPIGGTTISSGIYRKKKVEIRIEAPDTTYVLTGKYAKGKLAGTVTTDTEKATWECQKQADSSQ